MRWKGDEGREGKEEEVDLMTKRVAGQRLSLTPLPLVKEEETTLLQ